MALVITMKNPFDFLIFVVVSSGFVTWSFFFLMDSLIKFQIISQVVCTTHPACSERPITITITDECPGACNNQANHFDLSEIAFGALVKPDQADTLSTIGQLNIGFQRVQCNYKGWKIVFHIDGGSNPFYLAFTIESENGYGDLGFVEVLPAGWNKLLRMQQSWGATWKVDLLNGAKCPFSVRVTTIKSRRTLVSYNVIPTNWALGQTYYGSGNFYVFIDRWTG